MKTVITLMLYCCIALDINGQNRLSGSNDPAPQDLNLSIDGKNVAIIPAVANPGATYVSMNLPAGQHIIRLKPIQPEPASAVAPPSPEEPVAATPNSFTATLPLSNRRNAIQQQIIIAPEESDSIRVELYDNGVIDNDTINLFKDDKLLLHSKRLTTAPLTFYTSFEKGEQVQRLKMEAQNLGLIAPNTALMVVTTRKARYTVHLSGDLTQNAVVELVLKR